jgi:hypothetical protein
MFVLPYLLNPLSNANICTNVLPCDVFLPTSAYVGYRPSVLPARRTLNYSMSFCIQRRNSPPVGQGLLIIADSRSHSTHNTTGRNPKGEWSARRTDLYMTTHNSHKRQTSTPPAGFEPTIPASERPQTQALDCAATGISTARVLPCRNHE